MIGGKIISITKKGTKITIKVEDQGQTACTDIKRTSKAEIIEIGGVLWWQSDTAYYTPPKSKPQTETEFERVGYSYGCD